MDKIKELFESALLSDESKTLLSEAFEAAIKTREVELQAEYVEKLQLAENELKEQLPTLIEEALAEEIAAIAEEVAHARTLEVQYAERLNQFKEDYAQAQEEKLQLMVAESVAEEFEEIKEDIELAKKHEFVMSMFESFKDTYDKMFGSADLDVYDQLKEAKEELDAYKRKETIDRLTEGLKGDKKEIAVTILEGVATDRLESKFASIKTVLLSEDNKPSGENKPLNENADADGGTLILENSDPQNKNRQVDDAMLARLQKSIALATGRK